MIAICAHSPAVARPLGGLARRVPMLIRNKWHEHNGIHHFNNTAAENSAFKNRS